MPTIFFDIDIRHSRSCTCVGRKASRKSYRFTQLSNFAIHPNSHNLLETRSPNNQSFTIIIMTSITLHLMVHRVHTYSQLMPGNLTNMNKTKFLFSNLGVPSISGLTLFTFIFLQCIFFCFVLCSYIASSSCCIDMNELPISHHLVSFYLFIFLIPLE